MQQVRLHVNLTEEIANQLAANLELRFEDSAFAIASFETDAEAKIWNVSLYCPKQDERVCADYFAAVLAQFGVHRSVESEDLDQINWVLQSLEGLAPIHAGQFKIAGSHDAQPDRPHGRTIIIDAGEAFGTGHHGTTTACLLAI